MGLSVSEHTSIITNPHILEAFERNLQQTQNLTLREKFALLDGMYELAVHLGHFTPERALDGIDDTIRLAKALDSVASKTPQ